MTLQTYADVVQGSDEWLEQRRGIVTASVVGSLIANRYTVALDWACPDCLASAGASCRSKRDATSIKTMHPGRTDVAAKARESALPTLEVADNDESRGLTLLLVAERLSGFSDPTYRSWDMLRGIDDEPIARQKYADTYAPVTEVGFMVRSENGWTLGYSPDGLVGTDGLIEIKSRRQKKHLQTILADEVPAENMAQLQAGLLVSGRQWIDYVSYCGGLPMWTKRVTPDPDWHAAIVAAVTAFEKTAAEMSAAYKQATKGLPATERSLYDLEMVI